MNHGRQRHIQIEIHAHQADNPAALAADRDGAGLNGRIAQVVRAHA